MTTPFPRRNRHAVRPTALLSLLVAALLLVLTACDGLDPNVTDHPSEADLLATAQTWHERELATQRHGKSSGLDSLDTSALLARFYPDWNHGQVLALADGRSVVMTTLGDEAALSFDSTLSIIRTLVVQVAADGSVETGNIVEFASQEMLALHESPDLVQHWLDADFNRRAVLAATYTVGYQPEQAHLYLPDLDPIPVQISAEICDPAQHGAGKMMATETVCYISDIERGWEICVEGMGCASTDTEIYLTCWDRDLAEPGDEEDGTGTRGGSSSGGETTGNGNQGSTPPEGVPDDYWNRLNAEEKQLCFENRLRCIGVYHASETAFEWAQNEEPSGAHNGPQDALRHAMWNAIMAWNYGYDYAKKWGDAHEVSSSDPNQTRMDLHNNEVGRQIGANAPLDFTYIEDAVRDARIRGLLCLYVGTC